MTTREAALTWQNSFCFTDYSYFGLGMQGLFFLLKSTHAHTIHMHTHRQWEIETIQVQNESEVKLLSRVPLFVTPWTVAYQVPPSKGFSRQEYWSGLPFPSPGDLPDPGIEPGSPAL